MSALESALCIAAAASPNSTLAILARAYREQKEKADAIDSVIICLEAESGILTTNGRRALDIARAAAQGTKK